MKKEKLLFLSKVFLKLGRLSCDNLIGSRKGNNFWELFSSVETVEILLDVS